ncbi:potassium/proton antiporter [Conexibacter sp. SYSU D00693]|uniref:potassium/proton antiporter n=1 Tax=Conexibacter sp. SYSU D00693 TaxID=2812560 RepID=UPI00196B2C56|nr:potassium/proton antiporter [Conexibacter sp. SYSU D00693]
MEQGELILVAGLLLAAGLAVSLVADRVRVPSLVLFLGVGMALGSDGLSLLHFDDYELARDIGIIALALILFEGGLTAGWHEVRPVLASSTALAVVGTAVSAAVTGLAAAWLFDLSTLEGLLLGSILASTDGAAIFAILRQSTLRRRLARTLEGESGLNDPVAVVLVLGFIEVLTHDEAGVAEFLKIAAEELAIGLVAGLAVGWLAVRVFQTARLSNVGLYPVASLATAALAFGSADALHGSGFLAVYLAGLAMGGAPLPAQQTITAFHQGMAWVGQLVMFFALGLLVFPSQLGDVAVRGTLLALILVFVARPAAVWASTVGQRFSAAEKAVLGWAGLRGAVPVVLATFPVIDGVEGSLEFFNLVFFAVLVSTVLQGSTIEPFARLLGVTTAEPALPAPLAEAGTIRRLGAEVLDYPVGPDDAIVGARVRELGLPREAVVTVVVREGQAIPPRGSMLIHAGDRLHILYREESARRIPPLMQRWRTGSDMAGGGAQVPRPIRRGAMPVFSVRTWTTDDGDPAHPDEVAGTPVHDTLRVRRDAPGCLVVLGDARYAVCGPLLAMGSRRAIMRWAQRRMPVAEPDERAWMRTVIGALAAEAAERR